MLGWLLIERIRDGKPTSLGAASGVVAGLVAITPACAFVDTLGRARSSVCSPASVCALAVGLKYQLGYDDSLDVVGVHLVGGLRRHPADRPVRRPPSVNDARRRTACSTAAGSSQLGKQAVAAGAVLAYSFVADAHHRVT